MNRAAICQRCAALTDGRLCRTCGAVTTTAPSAFQAWEHTTATRRLRAWRDEGRLDDAKLDELIATIRAPPSAPAPPPPSPPREPPRPRRAHGDEAQTAAVAVFGPSVIAAAGLDALAQLDEPPTVEESNTPSRSLGALHVFWLVGALLVLAGSLMGVREAWLSFDGVARPLVTTGALFVYHLGFVALARFLAPRSATTGRVLGVVAVGLLPIAFVAASVAIALSPIGVVASIALLAAAAVSVRALDRVFGATALAVVPSLAFMATLGAVPSARGIVAIAGLLPVAFAVRRAGPTFASALYGAVVVALFAWFGPPGEPVLGPTSFGAPFLVAVLWCAIAAALASVPRARTTSRGLRTIAIAALVSCFVTALTAVIAVTRGELLATGLLAYVPAVVGLLATATLVLEKRSLHLAVPIALAAVGIGAIVATDEPAYGFVAIAIVPFVLLLVPASWRRLTGWSIVGTLTVIPLWLNGHDLLTATVAAILALAAHAGARGRISRDGLGAALAFVGLAAGSGHPLLALGAIVIGYRLARKADIALAAASMLALLAIAKTLHWLLHSSGPSPLVSLLLVVAGVLVAFVTPALPRARGHIATLAVAGTFTALAAFVQHVAHPLSPTATGVQLVATLLVLWLTARILTDKGLAIATHLGRTGEQHYALVPRTAIFAIALVLLGEAYRLDTAVLAMPPLFLAAGGLGLLLLGRRPFLDLGVGALALAAIALATQTLAAPFLGAAMFCTLASAGWLLFRRTNVLVVPAACAAPLVVHALGLPTVLHAILAAAIVVLGLRRARVRTQGIAIAYATIALLTPTPLVLFVLAVASAPAAWSWRGLPGKVLAVLPPLVLGAAAYAYAPSPLLLVFAALVAHTVSFFAPEPARASTRVGRDLLLVGAAAVFPFEPSPLGIVIAIAVGLHAVAAQRTLRHVYFVELLVVGLYATLTRALDLTPVLEAMLGLGYGFTLLGVATLTRRLGLADVATATRRVLAVLPVLVGLLTLPSAPNDTAALFALVASVLYATAAFTNESRAFASLAAVAANGALVVFALAQGLDGIEIWLAPLGLVVAIVAQIFAPSLSPSARNLLRVAGGVLLYLPAGLKLALRLGAAEDPTYAVVFGAACLVGIAIGAVLRIRAYLALATLSLALDLVANLVHAGLRDHRLGFVLLSATGLAILGTMVLVTLRLEDARRALEAIRRRLGAWE